LINSANIDKGNLRQPYSVKYRKHISDLIDRSDFLLQTFKEYKNNEELCTVAESIISASRLEVHPEISVLAEYVKNILDALFSRSIKSNTDIVNVLSGAFKQMKDNLDNNGNQAIDLSIMKKIKMILDTAKHDEQDYLITKRIRVLYIDGDDFAQYIVANNCIDRSIQIESCLSGSEAIIKLRNERFDAILCDLKVSDPNVLKIFTMYSSRTPIVAISVSGDPKFIQMATKAGAMDYIIKSELGIKRVPRSLHSVVNEWIRRTNSSEIDDMKYYVNQVLEEIGKYRLLPKGSV
jgi:CheY-like chemotaxis protein